MGHQISYLVYFTLNSEHNSELVCAKGSTNMHFPYPTKYYTICFEVYDLFVDVSTYIC